MKVRNGFVTEHSPIEGFWRVYDSKGDMLREKGNRLVTNNGNEYYRLNNNLKMIQTPSTVIVL